MSVVFEECNAPSISKVTDTLSVEVFKLQYINAVCGEYSAPLLKDYPCRFKKKPRVCTLLSLQDVTCCLHDHTPDTLQVTDKKYS